MTSTFKTTVLLAGLTALFMAVGYLLGGQGGMVIAFVVALGMNLFSYWNSGNMVLGMYGAREVDARTAPEFYGIVQRLAERAGLPMPRVFIIESDQPNAFATGRDPQNAAVCATTGLLRMLSPEEVAGVMAHELAHVKNRDTLIMTVTATIAGAISMLANFGLFFGMARDEEGRSSPLGAIGGILVAILAPIAAMVVQMAISRTREYEADRIGAEICGRPGWLADALTNIHHAADRIPYPTAEAHPATAHLFIANPLHGQSFANLFSTHPAMEERVRRLRAMAGGTAGGMTASGAGGFNTARPSAGGPSTGSSGGYSAPSRGQARGQAPKAGPWGRPPRGPWG